MINKPMQPINGRKKYNAAAIVAAKQRTCVEMGMLPSISETSIAKYLNDDMPHSKRKKPAINVRYHFFNSTLLLVMLNTSQITT